MRQGFDRVTMRDIAAQAGCATGTIYLYFKTKQQVLNVITERHSDALLRQACEKLLANTIVENFAIQHD